ncbi:protein kinase [Streptomyces sp. NPDC047097]|uniref:protein kinase domain-containing protein n=1 Tax=Streptomyces sp. NPDC047097 TaxID=3155260 RepID=UPI00340DF543
MQPLEAGEPAVIGPFRLLGRLGAGGMGRVYLARSGGGRTVAVKVVHPHFAMDDEFRARFRREVASARAVGGRWTAPVIDADPEAPVPWVATAYVAGPPLGRAVAGHGPLPERAVRVLGAGLAEALSAVHGLGLVHRDVKPSNVLLALDGPRLIDFGIARATEGTASLTSTGVSVGSPGYMAPEQILGKGVTAAADVFSLGAVLAYAACGTAPFPGDSSAALLYKVVHEEAELGAGLTGELRELVAGCLAKDPEARPDPAALARALLPEGLDAALAAGWLPGPLVEEVSRTAVRLLDLEPEGATDAGVAGHSGPVPFSSPALGVFGPPTEPSAPPSSPGVPPRPDAPPEVHGLPTSTAGKTGPAASPRGPLAVSVTTESERGPGRSRRLSCTVVLAVAGALAAVTVGGGWLLGVLRQEQGRPSDTAGRPPAATASRTPSPSSSSSPSSEAPGDGGTPKPSGPADSDLAAMPEGFSGTWKGPFEFEFLGDYVRGGTFTLTLTGGERGGRVGTADQYDALGNLSCQDRLVLRRATATELVLDGSSTGKPEGNKCTSGTHTVTLTLKDGKLAYVSEEQRAGNPRATLTREAGGG